MVINFITFRVFIATTFVITVILSACSPSVGWSILQYPPATRLWQYADLRALDAADPVPSNLDLTAIYSRLVGSNLEIRLDLLDMPSLNDSDIYIVLDTSPGGSDQLYLSTLPGKDSCASSIVYTDLPWDILLVIPANSSPEAHYCNEFIPPTKIIPRIIRDTYIDTITIILNRNLLPGRGEHSTLQAFITPAGEPTHTDQIGPVRTDGLPPSQRAPTILDFYNTFSAATPAQALRRWDGAHTSPLGERHGLKHLLEAANNYQIPITLLDLKTPASLSALDAVGGMNFIHALLKNRLLLLPDVGYNLEYPDIALAFNRRLTQAYSLPASPLLYGFDSPVPTHHYRFADFSDSIPRASHSHLTRNGDVVLIPLNLNNSPFQLTPVGLSLDVRRAILNTALSPEPTDLVILGGNFSQSTWGSPNMVSPAFAYLASRPWIWPLTSDDLLTFPALPSPHNISNNAQPEAPYPLLPDNPIAKASWETYFTLASPFSNPLLRQLRSNYLGQVTTLSFASKWAEHPYKLSDCASDIDQDGENECLLASKNLFAVLETSGARLMYLFSNDENGVHQLIGPTAQFEVGISDPSLWYLSRGEAADPGQVMGAFSDIDAPFQTTSIKLTTDGAMTFTSVDGSRIKTYRLIGDGIEVTYQSQTPVTTQIPLVVDPWTRYQPGWTSRYQASQMSDGWLWGLDTGPMIQIRTSASVTLQAFNESLSLLSVPEFPNREYPPGHFLPFPIALVEITSPDDFEVKINCLPK